MTRTELFIAMQKKVDEVVKFYRGDFMYDIEAITNREIKDKSPCRNWMWFLRETGTDLWEINPNGNTEILKTYQQRSTYKAMIVRYVENGETEYDLLDM